MCECCNQCLNAECGCFGVDGCTRCGCIAELVEVEPPPTWGLNPWPILRHIKLAPHELDDPIPSAVSVRAAYAFGDWPPAEAER